MPGDNDDVARQQSPVGSRPDGTRSDFVWKIRRANVIDKIALPITAPVMKGWPEGLDLKIVD